MNTPNAKTTAAVRKQGLWWRRTSMICWRASNYAAAMMAMVPSVNRVEE